MLCHRKHNTTVLNGQNKLPISTTMCHRTHYTQHCRAQRSAKSTDKHTGQKTQTLSERLCQSLASRGLVSGSRRNEVLEGNIRKTMAARGLVNGRSRAISESSGGCSQRTAKWEGFSFPLLSSGTSLHPTPKNRSRPFWVGFRALEHQSDCVWHTVIRKLQTEDACLLVGCPDLTLLSLDSVHENG